MDKPFTPIVLSTITGIILAYYFELSHSLMFFILLLSIIAFIFNLVRNRTNIICILIIFIALGVLIVNLNMYSELDSYKGKNSTYTGIIEDIIKETPEYIKYAVKLNSVDNKSVNEKIVLTIVGEEAYGVGDIISFNGVLKEPDKNTNPLLFNYKLNLLSNKVHYVISVKDFSVSLLQKSDSLKYKIKEKFTTDVKDLFNLYLDSNNANVISSIILGDTSYLDEEILNNFRDLGLAHILAVSGLHIGIISGTLIFIFSRIGINRKVNIIISMSIVWIYCYLIGFPPSTVRAGIMLTFLYISTLIHEPYDSINTVMFSILISLYLNPFLLFHLGFQLSYIATLSIIILAPSIKLLFYPFKNKVIDSISVILAVNIGLLPVQAYYFNIISLLSLAANIIAVPLMSLSLVLGFVMILFNYTLPFLNVSLGIILDFLMFIQSFIVDFFTRIPINTFKIYSPNLGTIILYYLAIVIILRIICIDEYKSTMKKVICYYLVLLTIINIISFNIDNHIEIDFIDVGQGDSILIKTQGNNYLMDTGGSIFSSNDIGKYITLPYLIKHGIFKLEAVFISHFDEDHYKGLETLLDEIKIDKIYVSYIPDKLEVIQKIKKKNIPIYSLKKGDIIYLDYNTSMKIIWPDDNVKNKYSSNNMSLVSLLNFKHYNVLFTGDIEKEVECILANRFNESIDVIKVAHHGSSTSTTEGFLNSILPDYGIISVGKNNFYGHPTAEVLARLDYANVKIYRTDEMGMIRIFVDDNHLEIVPFNTDRPSIKMLIYYGTYILISLLLIKRFLMNKEEGVDLDL